ncbi:AmmeMemoRadiSam system protein A [Candidatus Parabeggiatoa sp. HSG14]|uniref:AmmeMemoRadiSam system protein A n=1 Tax=Candidatus Parabeggiatoa sp. HSG14 TaxID=3055593 RepID=UPI0025A8B3AB|nr:AmmeMemoRadiSam system protein A [Thiotrichales bacterium HSG14]
MSLTKKDIKTLLQVAKKSIQLGLETDKPLVVEVTDYEEELQKVKATFVTLEINQNLRGCMGTITAFRPLISDVSYQAYNAAFYDPRFSRVGINEFPILDIHISILTEPKSMSFDSEDDLIQQLRPGVDGLIISDRGHRATFLPSVWESLTDPQDFLHHLKKKAGLPSKYWSDTFEAQNYTTESIHAP